MIKNAIGIRLQSGRCRKISHGKILQSNMRIYTTLYRQKKRPEEIGHEN